MVHLQHRRHPARMLPREEVDGRRGNGHRWRSQWPPLRIQWPPLRIQWRRGPPIPLANTFMGDGGQGGGEVPPRGLVSGHGAAVRSPASGQMRSSICFSACARTERVRAPCLSQIVGLQVSVRRGPWAVGFVDFERLINTHMSLAMSVTWKGSSGSKRFRDG
jgi:hypothetical protein